MHLCVHLLAALQAGLRMLRPTDIQPFSVSRPGGCTVQSSAVPVLIALKLTRLQGSPRIPSWRDLAMATPRLNRDKHG